MKSKLLFTLLLLVIMAVFLAATNPNEISLLAILVPFVILGLIIYQLIMALLVIFYDGKSKNNKPKIISVVLSFVIVNFALLSSIGQLTLQDGLIAILIVVIGAFYLYKLQVR